MNKTESNEKILELMNKYNLLSEKEIQLFKELIFQCDFKIQGKYGRTPLMYALFYNKSENLNLTVEQCDYLIKNSDLKIKDNNGYTPLMYALANNRTQGLNLNQKQFDYLIKNSDLKQQNKTGDTPLMYALINNKYQNLNLNKDQFEYLLKNSDLKQKNDNSWTPLLYALYYNKEQDLKLTTKQFKEMYNALNEEQKQTIFQNFIQENDIYNKNFVEEMNVLLYDCEFKPNKENIHWLKENKYKNIIKIIEKRDLLYHLENNLNNKEKNRNKIKI